MKRNVLILLMLVGLVAFVAANAAASASKVPEKKAAPKTEFERMDANGDGSISKAEFEHYRSSLAAAKKQAPQGAPQPKAAKPGEKPFGRTAEGGKFGGPAAAGKPQPRPTLDARKQRSERPGEFARGPQDRAALKRGQEPAGKTPWPGKSMAAKRAPQFGREGQRATRFGLRERAKPAPARWRENERAGRGGRSERAKADVGRWRERQFAGPRGKREFSGRRGWSRFDGRSRNAREAFTPGMERGRFGKSGWRGGRGFERTPMMNRPMGRRQWGEESLAPGFQDYRAAPHIRVPKYRDRRTEKRMNPRQLQGNPRRQGWASRQVPQDPRRKAAQTPYDPRMNAARPSARQQMPGQKGAGWGEKSAQRQAGQRGVERGAKKPAPKPAVKKAAPVQSPEAQEPVEKKPD